jgi:hypothetical protein
VRAVLICLNGHVIRDLTSSPPRYCGRCGAGVISSCPACGEEIRDSLPEGVAVTYRGRAPAFCQECGKPYPWIEARLEEATKLIDMSEVPRAEKEALREDLGALTGDAPGSNVAAIRVKKFLAKASAETASALRSILVEVATEATKKMLGL